MKQRFRFLMMGIMLMVATYAIPAYALSDTPQPDAGTFQEGDDSGDADDVCTISITEGYKNFAPGDCVTVSGGQNNTASGNWTVVDGGLSNTAAGNVAVVGGGASNTASGDWATISGGQANTVPGNFASISGGQDNTASGNSSAVGGGTSNTANGDGATISGGQANTTSGNFASIGGGQNNTASGNESAVGGGASNTANGDRATISGGYYNTASGYTATVSGGVSNTATGRGAVVPGGENNRVGGNYSLATGYGAIVENGHSGTFLFADYAHSNFEFHSIAMNEFAVRATGGVRFVTGVDFDDGTPLAGVELVSGSGSWATLSDRNVKAHFETVNTQDILNLVADLPITTWNYQTQDESIRHIGPMAQDFYTAFGLGEDDLHISTVDADGIALAAIQGLNEVVQTQESHIAELEARNADLESRLAKLENSGASSHTGMNSLLFLAGMVAGIAIVFAYRKRKANLI